MTPNRRLSSWSWCRHYNGLYGHETCNAGVRYEDVRDDSTHPYSWPCFQDRLGKIPCASQSFKTEEEIAAEAEKAADGVCEGCLNALLVEMDNWDRDDALADRMLALREVI